MIKNMTPCPVTIVAGNKTVVFESDGDVRLTPVRRDGAEIEGIPTVYSTVESNLPDKQPNVWLIVSQLVQTAYPDRNDLLTPVGVVRDETDYRFLGWECLQRNKTEK